METRKTVKEILESAGTFDRDVIAAKLGDRLVDLHTPIDPGSLANASLVPVRATDAAGLEVIRHSSAHVMADAVQKLFPGTKVTLGPAIEDGFFYDFERKDGSFTDSDLSKIEKKMRELIAGDTPFRREVVARDAAIKLFSDMGEHFKVEIIEKRPENEELTLYRHGKPGAEWVDFCMGPHVPSTGFLKAIKLTSVAGAYWRGDERNPMLQRIYGTAFPSQEALDEHLKLIEEAKQRDHRKLGKELELFYFDALAPAMPFFLPKGAYVYNRLVGYIRDLYEHHDYEEVITPQVFDPKLFKTSGHLGNYNQNMYRLWMEDMLDVNDEFKAKGFDKVAGMLRNASFALKPMNCPSHCLIFGSKKRSYRELPWRVADFGRLHRYERGGVVHGLSRVRSFSQDDGHIFCTPDQALGEIERFIKLLYEVYATFKFEKIDVKLAMRPENRIGKDEDWDLSEGILTKALTDGGLPFEILQGEGAFYGPKVEFHVQDALKRSWQLGTIQFDANFPERFNLSYIGADGKEHRPIMLHRAVLGSLERFFSVFLEHCGGNFPTWIAPKQAMIIPVHEKFDGYANHARDLLRGKGLRVDVDLSTDKLGAKVRNARMARYPYVCVVGGTEEEAKALGVRSRDKGELGPIPLEDFAAMVLAESKPA